MMAKKLFVLLLSALFLFGTVGVAAADKHEMKKSDEKKTEKKAAKAKNANGNVKSASADTIVVAGKEKGKDAEWTFAVDAKTKIKKGGKDITAKDLVAGDPVHVQFAEADGKMLAKSITVKAGGTAKKMEKKAENPCAAKK